MPVEKIVVGRSRADAEQYGSSGAVFIGKSIVGKGEEAHLANPVFMDVIRPHVVLICGKRGCLRGETLVFTDRGYKELRGFDAENDRVLSFNKEKKEFEWERAELLKYQISNENLLKIELADGRIITLTKEHPLLVNYGKYVFWRHAKDLKINNKIVLPTNLPETNRKSSLRLARILGFVLSDGTMSKRKGLWKDGRGYWYKGTKNRLRIFCDCEEVLKRAKSDLEEEFGLFVKKYKRSDCNCSVIQSLHAQVTDKISSFGIPIGNKAGIIRIPKIVWENSNEFKANFLSALFSCDGFISKNGMTIDYSCKSRKFLEDMQLLLTHFNIESSIRLKQSLCEGKRHENYRLFITDNTSIENFKKIGFIDPLKQSRLESHKSNKTKKRKTYYISGDLVCRKIKKIEEVNGISEVYDLSVDKNHSFIANGVISHNSGKSYTSAVIGEGITLLPQEIKQNLSVLMIDTMGIFWSMKKPNERDAELLGKWDMKPSGMDIKLIVPKGYAGEYEKVGVSVDCPFTLSVSELTDMDWIVTFGFDMLSSHALCITRAVKVVRNKYGSEYSIDDIIKQIEMDAKTEENVKNLLATRFLAAKEWGIFERKGTSVAEIFEPGKVSVLDVSHYERGSAGWSVRTLLLGILARKIFQGRLEARKGEEFETMGGGKKEVPMVWIIIDEAHQFVSSEQQTVASEPLLALIKEGREPGISVLLITQMPNKLHPDALAQCDLVISHRLTAKSDIFALKSIMQTYILKDIQEFISALPRDVGSAVILDDNSERLYAVQIRPRLSWHAGGSPTAIPKKELFSE